LTGGSSSYTRSGKRAYGQNSRFGTVTSSRHGRKRSGRHELHSGTELDEIPYGFRKDAPTNLTNTFWKGDDSLTKDSESERRVLDEMDRSGNIRKTVSVMINASKQENMDDGERSSGSSIKKFEHV
jgi:hypothetical protein